MTTRGPQVASVRDDELLSRIYQRLANEHAAELAAGYGLAAGLSRYRTWLDARTAGEPVADDSSAADRALTELYLSQYRSLVRLASLLMRDAATAEEVVQDASIELHKA
jgi:glycogen debranching enzyme